MAGSGASASGLSVVPTQLDFAADDSVQALHLRNTGNTIINAQLRVFSWSQNNGEDSLVPSTDLIVSPPIMRVVPGQQQLVRVVHTASTPPRTSPHELSYRLIVDELPPAEIAGSSAPRSGLNFVLRYSIPVFVAAATPVVSAPATVALESGAADTYELSVLNPTPRHLQLADLRLLDKNDREIFGKPGLIGYVLPGSNRSWPLTIQSKEAPTSAVEVQVRINGKIVRNLLSEMPMEWSAP